MESPIKNRTLNRRATLASISVAGILTVTKLYAWYATDSVAILTSLVDSLLDLGASIVTFYAVSIAYEPADEEHKFSLCAMQWTETQ